MVNDFSSSAKLEVMAENKCPPLLLHIPAVGNNITLYTLFRGKKTDVARSLYGA